MHLFSQPSLISIFLKYIFNVMMYSEKLDFLCQNLKSNISDEIS